MLWIAVHLPALSLESFSATLTDVERTATGALVRPVALLDTHRITAADAAARSRGVKPGLKRATALALAPDIVLGEACARRDAEALRPIAESLLAWTPMVCVQPARGGTGHGEGSGPTPDTVLLEVASCLRYHGGLAALRTRLETSLRPFGHAWRIAVAATAQAAAVLAHVDPPPCCLDLAATRAELARAPVWLLGPGRDHWEALQGMGLHVIDDLMVLPRSGVARRFGTALLDELDRATGARPDRREPLVLPPTFSNRLELHARADHAEQVLHGAAWLIERLTAWLSARHAQVRSFRLVMRHEPRWRDHERLPATTLTVPLAQPSRDRAHLLMLLRERLGRIILPAPTLELLLESDDISAGAAPNSELFPTPAQTEEGVVRLVERLQARLGADRVRRLAAVADHRPERASVWHVAEAGLLRAASASSAGLASSSPASPASPAGHDAWSIDAVRPTWLRAPQRLAETAPAAQPLFGGRPLQLLAGPERIEAGWWDDAPIGRDYFIADSGEGALLWIYRDHLVGPGGWFLHGYFG